MKTGISAAMSTCQSLAGRILASRRLHLRQFGLLPMHRLAGLSMIVVVMVLGAITVATRTQSANLRDWLDRNAAYSAALNHARTTVDELILAEHQCMIFAEVECLERVSLLRWQLNGSLDALELFTKGDLRPQRSFPRVKDPYADYTPSPNAKGSRSGLGDDRYPASPSAVGGSQAARGEARTLEFIESQLESLFQAENIALKGQLIKQQEWHQKLLSVCLALTLAGAILLFARLLLSRSAGKQIPTTDERRLIEQPPVVTRDAGSHLDPTGPEALHLVSLARAEERANIARDIHDELGALLMAIMIDMKFSSRVPGTPRRSVDGQWPIMLERINAAMAVVSNLTASLRPSVIDKTGLLPAIESHLRKFEQYTRLACHLETDIHQEFPKGQAATDTFLIFQESLTNVVRHASATTVHVFLQIRNDALTLTVTDDGKGIPPDSILSSQSSGICGMSERAQRNCGMFNVEGQPMKGTKVELFMPLPKRP